MTGNQAAEGIAGADQMDGGRGVGGRGGEIYYWVKADGWREGERRRREGRWVEGRSEEDSGVNGDNQIIVSCHCHHSNRPT